MRRAISFFLVACVVLPCATSSPALGDSGDGDSGNGPVVSTAALANDNVQEDFPALCLDQDGTPWVAYVEHHGEYDGEHDVLRIAKLTDDGLKPMGRLAGPGVIHQPALARGNGALWAIWSQVDEGNVMNLYARRVVDGKPQGKAVVLADSPQGDVFADAGTDRNGRLWVAWQSFRNGAGDVYVKFHDARAPADNQWSKEIRVTSHEAGDWEPRLAFGPEGTAAIVFDSSRNGNFDVYLATVSIGGKVELRQLTDTPFYE